VSPKKVLNKLPRFHVPFWLSHILVYLFYFPAGTEVINKQSYC